MARKKVDINALLKKDFGGHKDWKEIIEYAIGIKSRNTEDILLATKKKFPPMLKMLEKHKPISLFGNIVENIPVNAYEQMKIAMSIPPAVGGAMMPDSHFGYSAPIGAVIATDGVVVPSFIGYDVSCMMMVTIFDMDYDDYESNKDLVYDALHKSVNFGMGSEYANNPKKSALMDSSIWNELGSMKPLKHLAEVQLGTSGAGNHFADIVLGTKISNDEKYNYIPNKFIALMTHSGSRGLGNKVAKYYMALADAETARIARKIPNGYGWLDMKKDSGREYWKVMEFLGEYSLENHKIIHKTFLKNLKSTVNNIFVNRHNFAWMEDGFIVHRKGATPAHAERIGIIPGSSGSSSYLTCGLGNEESYNSSSHGAGRVCSRTEAKEKYNESEYTKHMSKGAIITNGVDKDETYQAYKNIEDVMNVQNKVLLDKVAHLQPRIVFMGGAKGKQKSVLTSEQTKEVLEKVQKLLKKSNDATTSD